MEERESAIRAAMRAADQDEADATGRPLTQRPRSFVGKSARPQVSDYPGAVREPPSPGPLVVSVDEMRARNNDRWDMVVALQSQIVTMAGAAPQLPDIPDEFDGAALLVAIKQELARTAAIDRALGELVNHLRICLSGEEHLDPVSSKR